MSQLKCPSCYHHRAFWQCSGVPCSPCWYCLNEFFSFSSSEGPPHRLNDRKKEEWKVRQTPEAPRVQRTSSVTSCKHWQSNINHCFFSPQEGNSTEYWYKHKKQLKRWSPRVGGGKPPVTVTRRLKEFKMNKLFCFISILLYYNAQSQASLG